MIIKSYQINQINPEIHNLLLFYGKNEGLKNEVTKNITNDKKNINSYDEKEVTREISGKTLENLDPNDGDKSITYFKTPKDVQGTVMLSHTHINDDDDQWLY